MQQANKKVTENGTALYLNGNSGEKSINGVAEQKLANGVH